MRTIMRWPAALVLLLLSCSVFAEGFSLTDSRGRVHELSSYKGKWVLVNFWATWCPPCLEEIPDLVALYEARRDKDLIGRCQGSCRIRSVRLSIEQTQLVSAEGHFWKHWIELQGA